MHVTSLSSLQDSELGREGSIIPLVSWKMETYNVWMV